jgi:hypothetical protein
MKDGTVLRVGGGGEGKGHETGGPCSRIDSIGGREQIIVRELANEILILK